MDKQMLMYQTPDEGGVVEVNCLQSLTSFELCLLPSRQSSVLSHRVSEGQKEYYFQKNFDAHLFYITILLPQPYLLGKVGKAHAGTAFAPWLAK